jgi:DNA primase
VSGTLARAGGPRRGADDWVERVRAASDIVEVVGQTVTLKRVGRNWMGLCPFHKEKTPSFSVNAERQFYHCFSCKAGGDVFKFVQETEKVGFLEAAELLSRRAGIPVPERGSPGERGARTRLLEALEQAAAAYERWLADESTGAPARAHLERRGISRETARAFRLGFAPPGWEHLAQRLGRLGESTLIEAGLASRRDSGGVYDRFRNRLMVPLVAPGGAVLGFGARALAEGDEPKYLNSPESAVYHKGAFLFGLDPARRRVQADGEMIVVEGYFDAIAMHQAGLGNTVATSGTAFTSEQARLLGRMVARVAVAYDGDAAGQNAMMRSLGTLLAEGLDVAVVDLPAGQDPDTLVRTGGAEAWHEARRRAGDAVEFVQRHVMRGPGAGDPRERALRAVVTLGTGIPDPVRLRLLLERASQVLGFPESVMARAVALQRRGEVSAAPVRAAVSERQRQDRHAEVQLLRALLLAPEALDEARRAIAPDAFRDPACAALAAWLWSGRTGPPEDESAAALARELTASDEPLDWREEARGAARILAARQLKERKRTIEQALRRAEGDEAARLLQEIQDIASSLRHLNEREERD